MKKSLYPLFILFLFALLTAFVIFACSDEGNPILIPSSNNGHTSLKKSYIPTMEDIEEIAKSLSILMEDENYREFLETEIRSSNLVENIIEASILFDKYENSNVNKLSKNHSCKIDILSSIAEHISYDYKEEFINNMKNLKFGMIDIYFPYKSDRINWKADNELIVAPINSCMVKEQKSVKAYKLGGGIIEISTSEKPDLPVLVVTPSEKKGNYSKSSGIDDILFNHSIQPSPTSDTPPIYYYKTFIRKFRVDYEYDGGLCGTEMEIYFKIRTRRPGSSWGSWSSTGTYNAEPGDVVSIYRQIASLATSESSYTYDYEIEIWEDDDFLCGGDDAVNASAFDNSFLGSDPSYPTFEGSSISVFSWLTSDRYINEFDSPTESNNVYLYHIKTN